MVVAGDLIWDFNLVQHPGVPAHHHEAVRKTILDWRFGGAWCVAEFVGLACGDLPGMVLRQPRRAEATIAPGVRVSRAYSLWAPFPVTKDEGKKRVWRIGAFLGCQAAEAADAPCPLDGDVPDPAVLVLDDLNLGFRDQEDLWPLALGTRGDPGRIVLKTAPPLGEGKLWAQLAARFADRLTVVLSAAALREGRAPISEGLSWDQTIEDTVRELTAGVSAADLGRSRRVIVQFESEGAAVFGREPRPPGRSAGRVAFERFLYHPDEMEGGWLAQHPGTMAGGTSILTAAVVRHELAPQSLPIVRAVGRGLGAIRRHHEAGGGERFSSAASLAPVGRAYRSELRDEKGRAVDCASAYCTAVPAPDVSAHSDLLGALTGPGLEYVYAKAVEVVLRGAEAALGPAPKARFEKYLTVDRQEIERINAIRRLMLAYRSNPADTRPLAIAVFGQPGTGKSFAIKQLGAAVLGRATPVLEFNLSQFGGSVANLHQAFHQVRDASVRGQMPLVFWDEFDAEDLVWLKEFLAPVQDAEFREGGISHPFGKSIFVFAGGTCHDVETFLAKCHEADPIRKKAPDFASRLRGFVNIKGPNPVSADDAAHLIRRAIILRTALERMAAEVIDPETKLAAVSANVVRAFLRVTRFPYGARSLESVVTMSRLAGGRHFGAAHLPPPDLLRLHVTNDFLAELAAGQLEAPAIEALAMSCHRAWSDARRGEGWTPGPERDDERKVHPWLVPWDDLPATVREQNRLTARLTQAKLHQLGYRIVPGKGTVPGRLGGRDMGRLMEIEHDIWLRDHLLHGYEWAPGTDEALRLHRDVARFAEVPAEDKVLDRVIAESIVPTLARYGFGLERMG